jgi:hypothetical protein
MSPEGEVRSASQRFYSALNRMLDGDAGPLAEIWSHDATVTTMHPIGGREVGWESVGGSWSQPDDVRTHFGPTAERSCSCAHQAGRNEIR